MLRETRLGVGEAMAKLALASALADDVRARPMHPGLFDLATGFAMHLIDGYREGEALWVPVSYGTIRVHAPLEANLVSVVTNAANNRAASRSVSVGVVFTAMPPPPAPGSTTAVGRQPPATARRTSTGAPRHAAAPGRCAPWAS